MRYFYFLLEEVVQGKFFSHFLSYLNTQIMGMGVFSFPYFVRARILGIRVFSFPFVIIFLDRNSGVGSLLFCICFYHFPKAGFLGMNFVFFTISQ